MNVHFSSKKQDWATPWLLFQEWAASHGPFELDVCATVKNAKCKCFFSPADDGLIQEWRGICWMNPPYGRDLPHWISKAVAEVRAGRASRVVCLIPARTDTAWWHDFVLPYGAVHYLRGRVRFEGAASSAPFPSAVVIFEKRSYSTEALFGCWTKPYRILDGDS